MMAVTEDVQGLLAIYMYTCEIRQACQGWAFVSMQNLSQSKVKVKVS